MSIHDIDDVVQTVVTEVCAAEALDFPSERHFVKFCVQKAEWRAGDMWRHHGRVIPGEVPEHHHSPDVADLVGDKTVLAQLLSAIDGLTPRRRTYLFADGDADARDEARQVIRRIVRSIEGFGGVLGGLRIPSLAGQLRRFAPASPVARRSMAASAAATAVALAITLSTDSLRHDVSRVPHESPRTTRADFLALLPVDQEAPLTATSVPTGVAPGSASERVRPRTPIMNPFTGEPTGVEVGPEQPGEEGTLICGAQTVLTDPICLHYPEVMRALLDR